MQYVVRFDRPRGSTGPDAVLIMADRYAESYREGQLVAYQFLDEEGNLVAMVRALQVTYIAVAGYAVEPAPDLTSEAPPASDEARERDGAGERVDAAGAE